MSIPHQNFPENSLQFKTYKGYLQGGNGISFWAFLLSILAYISIFYIFNLSPSSALNTTQFWFFISNTLILIIAADSGAFFSWRKQPDPYEEYATINRGNSRPSFDSQYREIVNKKFPSVRVENSKESREEIKEVVVEYGKGKSPENKLQMIAKGDLDKSSEKCQENVPEFTPKVDNEARGGKENEAKCVRTMSDLGRPVTRIEKNIVLRRTGSEKHDPEKDEDNKEKEEEEEDEFAAMSNEELNRRVEEFIRRFNRQIRLQATQNKCDNLGSSLYVPDMSGNG